MAIKRHLNEYQNLNTCVPVRPFFLCWMLIHKNPPTRKKINRRNLICWMCVNANQKWKIELPIYRRVPIVCFTVSRWICFCSNQWSNMNNLKTFFSKFSFSVPFTICCYAYRYWLVVVSLRSPSINAFSANLSSVT